MSKRGASPFSVAQRPLRAGRATKPARFYDEVRDRERGGRKRKQDASTDSEEWEFFFFFFSQGHFALFALFLQQKRRLTFACSAPQYPPLTNRRTAWRPSRELSWAN